MKRLIIISISCLFLFSEKMVSQQLDLVSNTHFNIYDENVGFAGNYNATHFSAQYFKLWNINGAPVSYRFSAHLPIKIKQLGFGIRANQTKIGAHEELLAKLSLSYKFQLGDGLLSFGLGAGISQYHFNLESLNPLNPQDILLDQNALKTSLLDVDFGLIYTDDLNYAGIEINQLTRTKWNLTEQDSSSQIPHFKASAGHVFVLRNSDFIRVSLHSRTDINLKIQTDLMANYFYRNKVWLGTGIRLNYGVLANLELNVNKRLHAGYSTSIPLFSVAKPFDISHSIFIGYMLPSSSKKAPSARHF